jgi:hypothetical protein
MEKLCNFGLLLIIKNRIRMFQAKFRTRIKKNYQNKIIMPIHFTEPATQKSYYILAIHFESQTDLFVRLPIDQRFTFAVERLQAHTV